MECLIFTVNIVNMYRSSGLKLVNVSATLKMQQQWNQDCLFNVFFISKIFLHYLKLEITFIVSTANTQVIFSMKYVIIFCSIINHACLKCLKMVVLQMASLAATNWHKPLSLIPCLSWSTASAVFTQVR